MISYIKEGNAKFYLLVALIMNNKMIILEKG